MVARMGLVIQRLDNFDFRQEADSPFGFAQGRLFGNDNKESKGNNEKTTAKAKKQKHK
jgi:hypothetical protein